MYFVFNLLKNSLETKFTQSIIVKSEFTRLQCFLTIKSKVNTNDIGLKQSSSLFAKVW